MDNKVDKTQPSVDEIAAGWVVKMEESDLTKKEVAELNSWLKESEANKKMLVETAFVYGHSDILKNLEKLVPLKAQSLKRKKPVESKWAIPIVVSFFLVCFSFLYRLYPQDSFVTQVYSTKIGENSEFSLNDGSVVTLNTNTRISVQFSKSQRNVFLEEGQAFFNVAKDSSRPFTVSTDLGEVRAVGTAFGVYKRSEGVEVIVEEGTVAVKTSDNKFDTNNLKASLDKDTFQSGTKVTAGQMVIYSSEVSKVSSISHEKLTTKLLWKKGMILFEGEPLIKVVNEFSRYSKLKVRIVDMELSSIKVDGIFNVHDIEGMLASLRLNFNIELVKESDSVVLLKKKIEKGV
ncbi:FecR domain-containing protein [Pseudoalteromonas sp. PAR1]|uniref:FecR family protein n=1 Tax=Pseudoalteromonas sp. PAR1 TaxID=2853443 RepID=UPI00248AF8A8|nr:FecR domain-containing protein [Pseudoalteromonas sp. PAR1]